MIFNKIKVCIKNKLIEKLEKQLEIKTPINNEIIGYVPMINSINEINEIFEFAKNSFDYWKKTNIDYRIKLINEFKNKLINCKDEIIKILVYEIAKSKTDAEHEFNKTIEFIDLTINEYVKMMNDKLILDESVHHVAGKKAIFERIPLGVVFAIAPFNYPLNLSICKIIPALISGNVVVFKPSSQGAIIGAKISELLYESGFNNGEFQCMVYDTKQFGDIVFKNTNINMVSFTGSSNVGLNILKHTYNIPVVLEMGGKDAAIVLNDINLEYCANEIIKSAFTYNGQRCTATKRVFVHSSKYYEFINIMNEKIKKLTIGSALDNTFITELISEKNVNFVKELVNDAFNKNAKSEQKFEIQNNKIIHPMILYDLDLDARILWEEQFAPILPIISFNNIDECIKLCNKSNYGLQSSVFTNDLELANYIANELEVGSVNINKPSARSPDILPFLGVKNSGFGVQGIKDTILSMTRYKGIVFNKK